MVKGRVDKTVRQMCLMEAPFIKNLDQKVEQVVNASIAKLGEKISVRRFVRYTLPAPCVSSSLSNGAGPGH